MATSYLSPGVYVEEVDRGSKPIEAVGTNTVGFLGESAKGPLNEAVLITNWSQFVKTFGDFKDCSRAPRARGLRLLQQRRLALLRRQRRRPSTLEIEQAAAPAEPARKATKKADQAAPVSSRRRRPRRPLHRQGRRPRRAHRPQVLRRDRRDRDRRGARPDLAGGAGRAALALRDAQGSLRDSRLAGDDHGRRRQAAASRATRSTARTTSRGSRSTTRTRATSSFRRRATSRASTRAPTASAASTRRRRTRSSAARSASSTTSRKGEQDLLNPKGINAIRFMNGGASASGAPARSRRDPSWRYINVRRLFIMVESSIERATQWVVFEPNDHRLWKRVQRTISLVPHAPVAQRRAHGRRRRSRPSTSSATRRPTRPRSSTPASWSSRSASRR